MPSCDFSHKMKVADDGGGILTGNVSMDDFELLKVLGKGAYGKVFQVNNVCLFFLIVVNWVHKYFNPELIFLCISCLGKIPFLPIFITYFLYKSKIS